MVQPDRAHMGNANRAILGPIWGAQIGLYGPQMQPRFPPYLILDDFTHSLVRLFDLCGGWSIIMTAALSQAVIFKLGERE